MVIQHVSCSSSPQLETLSGKGLQDVGGKHTDERRNQNKFSPHNLKIPCPWQWIRHLLIVLTYIHAYKLSSRKITWRSVFHDFFFLCPRPSSISYSPGKTQTKVPVSPWFQPTTTQNHSISQWASVHIWGKVSPHSHDLITFPSMVALGGCRGEQLEFRWGSGDPFGEDAWAAIKSRLGAWKQAHTFSQGIPWSPRAWSGCGSGGGRRTEASGLQVVQPSEAVVAGGWGTQTGGSSHPALRVVLPHCKTLIRNHNEMYLTI